MQNLKFFYEGLIMWWWVSDLFWTRYFLVFCPGSAILLIFFFFLEDFYFRPKIAKSESNSFFACLVKALLCVCV